MIQRREFLYLYDLKNINPNGDPDTNSPRIDPATNKCYVTDVRLKRYIRDLLAARFGEDAILVTRLGTEPVTLQKRVEARLDKLEQTPETVREALCQIFIDLRMFGSPLAFNLRKDKKNKDSKGEKKIPSLTGPIQIQFGESLHPVVPVTVRGTSQFAADEDKGAGTFTEMTVLPYAAIAFHGIINEYAARHTGLTDDDVALFLDSLWKAVRESPSANTRSKTGQRPLLLLNVTYASGTEYHIGRLTDLVRVERPDGGDLTDIRGLDDYRIRFEALIDSLVAAKPRIDRIEVWAAPQFLSRYPDLIDSLTARLPETLIVQTQA
ncbi:MAG: type I-B CRISPR-associated protein Cas7/Csh2 [Bacilli bacterium]